MNALGFENKASSAAADEPAPSQNRRRRILMLTHRVPYPPDRGDRIRSWNILQHLSKECDVSLACVSDEPICPDARQRLESVCDRVAIAPLGKRTQWLRAGASAVRGDALTAGLFYSSALAKTVDRWADSDSFDSVFVYCSGMLRYVRSRPLCNLPKVVDLVDVDSQKFHAYADNANFWKRVIYRTEARRVGRLEHEAVRTSQAVTLVSDAEADVLRTRLASGGHAIHGVPNGVDTTYFAPQTSDATAIDTRSNRGENPKLAFVGVMNYPPNVAAVQWFLEHVWSGLRREIPGITFDIIGKHPSPAVNKLAQLPGVLVTGAVPDVRPYLRSADIVIAPLQIARGIQNKVLEAMAMGKPVIASPHAATGIDAVDGQHLRIAETADQWAQQVVALCRDRSQCERIARDARQLVCQRYTWPATLAGFDSLLQPGRPAANVS
ncbi:D-inositol-3-phosphate glycosyltransferase [Rosistilla oblonga]|uniref:TIGR03087 family PEP-CTERM/XrtA system glycosyltransferase n=1 Tax=Rosistilla oblonga TaxID=2527990 RepID=UPI00118AA65E|nr:TIGR03087 family PEP-CTERM/XrtA system glycosyltransferase [Rosistilla oblonga]QDV14265.1 D-inositol-3-phosphate glycosyltransferase [Rosistilla oblonga]